MSRITSLSFPNIIYLMKLKERSYNSSKGICTDFIVPDPVYFEDERI